MPWAVAGALVLLWVLGLLSAYVVNGIAPTLLIGALMVVLLRGLQARWLAREGLHTGAGASDLTSHERHG